jgi:branched-chain amino acid transport system permease protein
VTGSELLRRAAKAGLIGGTVVIYLALVGMIEKFDVRYLVGSTVTLGKLLMALPVAMAGYLTVRPRIRAGRVELAPPREAVVAGLLCGVVAGGLIAAGVAVVHLFPDGAVRNVFISVSPTLLDIMTFGQSLPVAALVLTVGGALLGGLGAGLRVTPERYRRPLLTALSVTLLFALLQRIIPIMLYQLNLDSTWLYSTITGGLTVVGAVVVFAVSAAVSGWWSLRGRNVRQRVRGLPQRQRLTLRMAGLGAAAVILMVLPALIGSVLSQILGTVGIYVLMGLGLNIVVGYAGLLDLGYVAFFAAGAYTIALFTGANVVTSLGAAVPPAFSLHLGFYLAVPVVIMVAAFIGLLIGAPVLRLRGDYLAIVTLGFGEIARVLVTSDWLKSFLGGAQGLRDVTDAPVGPLGFRNPEPFYYLVLAFCALAMFVSWRLANSRIGRGWNAMREDELAAEVTGVSSVTYKLLAFAMGAGIGCLAGTLFAVKIGSLAPTSFDILVSITALAVVVLGGMGSIPGVVVGALVLIGLPGLLTEFEEYRLLLYGAVLIAIMILRPQGLIPNVRRMRELHEEELEQDRWLREQEGTGLTIAGGGGGSS